MADAHPLALAILTDGDLHEELSMSYLSKHRLDFLEDIGKLTRKVARTESYRYRCTYNDKDIHDACQDIEHAIRAANIKGA